MDLRVAHGGQFRFELWHEPATRGGKAFQRSHSIACLQQRAQPTAEPPLFAFQIPHRCMGSSKKRFTPSKHVVRAMNLAPHRGLRPLEEVGGVVQENGLAHRGAQPGIHAQFSRPLVSAFGMVRDIQVNLV